MSETVSQIQTNLSTGLDTTISGITGLTAPQKTALAQAASQLTPQYATDIVSKVTTTSNSEITNLTQNAIGPNNPLNIVSGNLTSVDVTKVLGPIVNTPLGSALTNNFVSDVTGLMKTTLSSDQLSGLNVDSLTKTLNTAVSGLMDSSLGTALNSFASQLMSGGSTVTPFFSSVSNLFSGGVDQALVKIDDALASTVSSKALTEAKKFDINNNENKEKIAATKQGFIDPTATYPTKEYAGRSETNKLATGDIKGTIVQSKEKERMLGAQLPNGESWDQPLSSFKGEYPYNKVIQTESGHIIELDDTPGSERLQVFHRSGTFIEIDANGSVVKRTKGSSYEIIDKNNYVAINGRTNVSINGACSIFVGADANIEVAGDTNILCGNDITAQAGGRIDLSAVEEINIRSKIIRMEADEAMHLSSDLKFDIQATTMNQKVAEDFTDSAANKYTTTSGLISINAGGNINVDGSEFHWNDGSSTAVEVEDAENAKIGLIEGRKTISEVIIADPIALNYTDYSNTKAEDSTDPTLAKQNQDQMIRDGITTPEEASESVVAGESSSPKSTVGSVILPSTELLKATELPGNFQLSKHITLAMLTTNTAVSKQKLQAQAGLTYGQIAYNLQGLALNVLEPVLALYPNALFTSCFRAQGSNPTSQHPKGMAVDIQIPGASKKDYYDIANKLAKVVNYDQLLLEYKTTGTGLPWIHISFDANRNRQQIMTFLNDKKHSDGFTQLA